MNKNSYDLSKWIIGKGPESDIVISSRIRIARNIEKIPFPHQSESKDLEKVINEVNNILAANNKFGLNYIDINNLSKIDKNALVEKHLISPPHANSNHKRGILLNKNEDISIMINEEDHLRIQILKPGLQLDKCWQIADEIDNFFEEELDFAFSKKWGYLSACPTNMGTGLRSSVMVHLPALNITNNIEKMLGAVSQFGLAVRGLYGEGSKSAGNIYQISNQITLGQTEKDIISNLTSVTMQILEQEKQARKRLLNENKDFLLDKIKRANGILKYAHIISNEEALKLLSYLKLGIDLEIINDIKSSLLSKLMVLIRPAHLQKNFEKEISSDHRDVQRAKLIKKYINNREE